MYPPSKHSPEFFKPQKPENHTGCCPGGCKPTEPIKVIKKHGCSTVYITQGGSSLRVGQASRYKTC